MTGDQSIQDLQSQVASLSGKIAQMQQSLGTGGIVMQVKSELAGEYKEIVGYSTNQVNHYQNTFWTVFSILLTLAGVIGYFFKKYIDNILEQITDKEKNIIIIQKDIITNKEFVDQQFQQMSDMQNYLDEQNQEIKLIQEKIESQDDRIFDLVMQRMASNWFDRLEKYPPDRSHLRPLIATLDIKYARAKISNYEALKKIYEQITGSEDKSLVVAITYQFFADKLFTDGLISEWGEMLKLGETYNYPEEIIVGTNLIFDFYIGSNEKNELDIELDKYVRYINKLLNDSIYTIMISEGEINDLKIFIKKKLKDVNKENLREETLKK